MDIEEQYDRIYRFCFYKVRNRQLAEDITQETFLRFLRSDYREQGRGMAYLYTIAGNLCRDEHRRRPGEPLSGEHAAEGDAFDERIVERLHFRQSFLQLPAEDQELLILRYVNGEAVNTLCAWAGISRFALYRKLRRIKNELKGLLERGELE